ncbi:MAG: HlyC/CorC family transporter [Clostridia bacterium]|nr:HlyC/CorC family transporter [Clostridia bacterium]
MNTVITIAVMALLVLMSAYFSATETAFSSLNRTRLHTMADENNKRAILAIKLTDNYDKLISTILIGNNIVNIALASIGTLFFVEKWGDIGATLSTVIITVVVLIFGEISPKSIAKDKPEKFALFSAPIINTLVYILLPLNYIFGFWKKLLNKLFGAKDDEKMSQEELMMLVSEVQQDGSIDKDEGELLKNVIEFTDLRASDILTHRIDLAAMPMDSTKEEIAECFSSTRFSRILIYNDDIDDIIGVLHQKDFYIGSGITGKKIKDILTQPVFIRENVKISGILQLLQSHKSQMAVVLDEYGGTVGIVTMEDILEELVGEIWDEHDEVVENFSKISDDRFCVDCSASIDDFDEFFGTEIDTESVTVGGWVAEMLQKIPEAGDSFGFENLLITVDKMDVHRVDTVMVTVEKAETEGDGEHENEDETEKEEV